MRRVVPSVFLVLSLLVPAAAPAAESSDDILRLVREVFPSDPERRTAALAALKERGNPDVASALILMLPFVRDPRPINDTLSVLTGLPPELDWFEWMLWQEAHPEIKPFAGFAAYQADLMGTIDENFKLFLRPDAAHAIRLEEIVWGGVAKDGIPALNNPKLIGANDASYLNDDDLVFGVAINGDIRAYPMRILDWHEMFNDTIGGVPVALAYCTLCASGILYETRVPGRAAPFVFGTSGLLYRSNKLMYDTETNSLWNQFTGKPVIGPLTGSGIELTVRPVAISSWQDWRRRHPDTKVLSLDTGHKRDYRPGTAYGAYYSSPFLMFPAMLKDDRLSAKVYVFALRDAAGEKVWPLSAFADDTVINDRVGARDVVLIGELSTRTVRAYDGGGRDFTAVDGQPDRVVSGGETWTVTEDALVGPGSERLPRLAGHVAYWFAWQSFKPSTALQGD